MTEKRILPMFAAALLGVCSAAAADKLPVITVDAARTLGPVNPLVFGHNMEAADARGIFGEPADAVNYSREGIKFGQGFWNPVTRSVNPEVAAPAKRVHLRMMRYPGGCLAHNFNWKQAVGPLRERGDWQFGLDEFIQLCRYFKAEPMITITDYALPAAAIPQHAAELVEYLNAPAVPAHPWAMKRKEWGHPEPYGVKWFELGNESDHGNHKCRIARRFSPAEYVKYANATAAAMRRVDPKIKIGVVTVPGGGDDYGCEWNRTVFRGAAKNADYVVVHFYAPGVDGLKPADTLKTAMALSEQLHYRIGKYHDLIKADSGRDLPLAVTEYNLSSTKNEPHFYRLTYTAGLMCADLMRLWLDPANRIATANYWQILNGYWGMYRSRDGKITVRRATLPFYELWGQHFGATLVQTAISNSPVCEAPATNRLSPACGDRMAASRKLTDIPLKSLSLGSFRRDGVKAASSSPSELTVDFNHFGKQSYLEFARFARPKVYGESASCSFRLTCEARFVPAAGNGTVTLGLGMCDSRGWDAVKSAIAIPGLSDAAAWKTFQGNFITLPDCPGATILLRVEGVDKPFSGRLEIRHLRLEAFSPDTFPAYRALTACSSLSSDGRTLYLMVFNKSPDLTIRAGIDLKGFRAASGQSFELFQPDPMTLKYFSPKTAPVAVNDDPIVRPFPPHSMTALEFRRR